MFAVALPAVASHFEAPAVLQSAFDRQATQAFVAVLHCGFAASLHASLVRHSTQTFVSVSQTLRPATLAQSEFDTHSTQVLLAVLHAGFGPEQCAFAVHCTQLFVDVQAGNAAGQCWSATHPTQTLFSVSHAGVAPVQCVSCMQPTQT